MLWLSPSLALHAYMHTLTDPRPRARLENLHGTQDRHRVDCRFRENALATTVPSLAHRCLHLLFLRCQLLLLRDQGLNLGVARCGRGLHRGELRCSCILALLCFVE